jgi:hypothetical protein
MSMKPANVTLRIPQRATLRKRFRLGIDGNGINIVAQVWDPPRKQLYINCAINWITRLEVIDGRPTCVFEIVATPAQTTAMKRDGMWDLKVITTTGVQEDYWMRGPAILEEGYSED